MKKPEDIPEALVEKARAAASAVPLTQNLSDEALRAILVQAWDFIYAEGFTDGFSDKEMSEQESEMVAEHGWSPHFRLWMEGATSDEAEALIDGMLETVESIKPEHVNVAGVGSLSAGHRHQPRP